MKSNYRGFSFSEGNTYNERTERFLGVDLTDPQMVVHKDRGVYSLNYMKKQNGRVETRFGFEQIHSDPNKHFMGAWHLNGRNIGLFATGTNSLDSNIFDCVLHEIAVGEHQKKDGSGEVYRSLQLTREIKKANGNSLALSVPKSVKPSAVATNDKLWLITGNGFYVIYEQTTSPYNLCVSKVSDWSGLHIPTVTYMGIAVNAKNIPSITNVTLEYPNMLTLQRKNMYLLGLGTRDDEPPYIELTTSTSGLGSMKIATEYGDKTLVLNTVTLITKTWNTSSYETASTTSNVMMYLPATNTVSEVTYYVGGSDDKTIAYQDGNDDVTARYFAFVEAGAGKVIITFGDDYTPVSPGRPNVTIQYAYGTNDDLANSLAFIDKCTIMARFGANNSLNRLWLAGNPLNPNIAIHSQEPYKGLETGELTQIEDDFTYFPDDGMIQFGSSNNAIVGMQVLTPEKMAVLKNRNGNERTMYFVSPSFVDREVGDGLPAIKQEVYSTAMSNTSTAGLVAKAVDNFNGDFLFLSSDKQIVGLDIEGITGDSQRVANTRSHYIDKALMEMDLTNAELFHFANYECMACGGKMFVSYRDSFDSQTGQYDWWPCTLNESGAKNFFAINDVVIFDTDDGIYLIDNEEVNRQEAVDTERYFVTEDVGESALADTTLSKLVVSERIEDKIDLGYHFEESDLERFSGDLINNADSWGVGPRVLQQILSHRVCVKNNQTGKYVEVVPNYYDDGIWLYSKVGGELCASSNYSSIFFIKNPAKHEPPRFYETPTLLGLGYPLVIGSIGSGVYYSDDDDTVRHIKDGMSVYNDGHELKLHIVTDSLENHKCVFSLDNDGSPYNGSGEYYGYLSESEVFVIDLTEENDTETTVGLYYRSGEFYYPFHGIVDLDEDEEDQDDIVPVKGFIEKKHPICPEFMSLRLTQGKLGYDKTVENITVWNDSQNPCELYVGCVTNKGLWTNEGNLMTDTGLGFDFGSIDLESTDFDQNLVPRFYNMKKFVANQQALTLLFSAKSKRNSVLCGVDILYKVRKAKNKR